MKESNKVTIISIFNFLQTRYQIPLRGICARARPHSFPSESPCPLVLRDGLHEIKYTYYGYCFILLFLFAYSTFPAQSLAQTVGEEGFLKWVEGEIEKNQKNEIELRPFERAKAFFNGPSSPPSKKVFVEPTQDFIYTEIEEPFEGDYKKAVHLYWQSTIGKQKPSLFIASGAGRDEKITDLHSTQEGVQFITDRVYQSALAFNSRTTIRLRRFDVESRHLIIVVNERVKDWGAELAKKKIKRLSKSYYPIFCDLNIDVYQEEKPNQFWYHSYALYRGQGMKSTYTSLNVAKKVGDIFSLGMLDRGLKAKLTSEAVKIWEKRRQVFQDLILSKDLKKAQN